MAAVLGQNESQLFRLIPSWIPMRAITKINLRRTASFIALTLSVLIILSSVTPSYANGGKGGGGGEGGNCASGGNGATGQTATAGAGHVGSPQSFGCGAGSGGGGAGENGGSGGAVAATSSAPAQSGGLGGTSGSPNGQNGHGSINVGLSAGSGGGGAYTAYEGGTLINVSALTGGNGGVGGNAFSTGDYGGGGGGGGEGGYGDVITGTGSSANGATIRGGVGGAGGRGSSGDLASGSGGGGGDGGVGVRFTGAGTITNTGIITGSEGGAGGAGGTGRAHGARSTTGVTGPAGHGGAGVAGSGITVIDAGGSISGGLNGDGITRGNAITFTGGANTLTMGGGTLIGGIGVTGSVNFNQSTSQSFFYNVTGTGAVVDSGTGTLTLSGTNSYTGGTEVQSGSTLILSGNNTSVTGTTTVDSGATLNGATTLGGNLVNNGTLMIDPGTMRVNGNYSGSGSFIEEFTGSGVSPNFDKLVVTGTATISGQTLVYDPIGAAPAAHYTNGAQYIIVTAHTISGAFSNVPDATIITKNSGGGNATSAANILGSDDPNLQIETTYTSTEVLETIVAGGTRLSQSATTPNETAVGHVLDTLQPTAAGGIAALIGKAGALLPGIQQAAALETLAGDVNANMQEASVAGMHEFNGMIAKRLGGDCNTNNALSNQDSQVSSLNGKLGSSSLPAGTSAWACGYGSFDAVSSNGGVNGYSSTLAGMVAGLEYKPDSLNLFRVGWGYGYDDLGVNSISETATMNQIQLGAYGQHSFFKDDKLNAYVGGTSAAGYNFINTNRPISAAGETATAAAASYSLSASGLVGFTSDIHGFTVEPVLSEEYIYQYQNSFTENGAGAADLSVSGRSINSLRSSLGAQVLTSYTLHDSMKLTPQIHAAFIYDAFDVAPTLDESISGQGFTINSANPGRIGAQGGAGATLDMGGGRAAFADYNGTFKEHETDNFVLVGLKYKL